MISLSVRVLVTGKLCWHSFAPVRHIPEWLPWLSYKPLARHGYDIGQQVLREPMEFVRQGIVRIWEFYGFLKAHSFTS